MLDRLSAPWLDRSNYPLDWNGPSARAFAPLNDLSRPLFDLFAEAAAAQGDRIAVDDDARRLSYAQLLAAAHGLAFRLAAETKPGDLVGILLPSSCDFIVAMLAALAAGRLFVPLDAHYPESWLKGVMSDCGMAAVLGRFDGPGACALVPEAVRRIDVAAPAGPPQPLSPLGADAPAFVLFTSGSTGKPKGIVNSSRALLRRVQQYVAAAHVAADDRFLPLSSECTIAGLRERFTALLTGATLHLIDVQRTGARAILDRLRDGGITMVYAVPALLRALMQLEAGPAPSSLRVVRVGGDAVLWSDVDALRAWLPPDCRIELGYSSTEAPIMQWFVPADFPRDGARVPLGYPLSGNAFAILGEDGSGVTPGEVGELVLRSPYVALGRWRRCGIDASDFPPDPSDPSCRIHRTGDLVRLRADGLVDLVGRKDRQIKIRGIRIEPAELEVALRRQPCVRDAAVFPRPVGRQWWLVAYVVGEVDPAALKAAMTDALPPALRPHRIHRVDAIPRLASAKLDMAGLAALDEAWQRRETEHTPSAPPQGATEEAVAANWCQVLGRETVGRDDDFFDLGGDSLATLNILFAIEEQLGAHLPVTAIYAAPTVAKLAEAIDTRRALPFSPLVAVRDGAGTPVFLVHGIGGNVMELIATGRRLDCDGPVYAVQARGLDGSAPPNETIAAMAEDYLAAIRAVFPEGPMHLSGYSSGGLVALEMARRLAPADVASLTLIDSQTNARQWPTGIWLALLARRALDHFRSLNAMPMGKALHYCGGVAASFAHRLLWRFGIGKAPAMPLPPAPLPPALHAVAAAALSAVARYRPAFYRGAVTLIVPRIGDAMRPDPALLWRPLCRSLRVVEAPGHHLSMVQGDNAIALAAALSDAMTA